MKHSRDKIQDHPQPSPPPRGHADPPRSIEILPETGEEHDATMEWLAHLAAGRIPCPEPDEGR